MRSEQVKALLNEKYSDGFKCLIAFEVNEGTGGMGGRRADAVALHLWPSLDYKIIGFEIKVSRADWLNELKQPEKSLPISQYCDEWYLVAPKGVLGIDELPKTWGYMEASENNLRTKIKAPQRDPIAPSKSFMASLVRSLNTKNSDANLVDELRKKEIADAISEAEMRSQYKIKNLEEQVASYMIMIQEFNQATGLTLNKWNLGKIIDVMTSIQNTATREDYISKQRQQLACLEVMMKAQKNSIERLEEIGAALGKENPKPE